MPILTLNDEEGLGQKVDHHEIVVIDFWAPWCAPCRGFLPILEKASESHPDIAFCRVNTEEHKELGQAFDVRSIPTLVVIRERIMIASQHFVNFILRQSPNIVDIILLRKSALKPALQRCFGIGLANHPESDIFQILKVTRNIK